MSPAQLLLYPPQSTKAPVSHKASEPKHSTAVADYLNPRNCVEHRSKNWGVINDIGEYLAWCVSEKYARTVFNSDDTAHQLVQGMSIWPNEPVTFNVIQVR